MLLLMFISFIGFLLSFVIHLCSLLKIYQPPKEITLPLSIGIIAVFYPAWFISNKIRKDYDKKEYKKAIFSVCPNWIMILNGVLIAYALVFSVYALIKHFRGSVNRDYRGFSSYLMAFYFLAFAISYCCRRLKSEKSNLSSTKIIENQDSRIQHFEN